MTAATKGGATRMLGLRLEDVAIGDKLPTKCLPLTFQRLIIEAGVNRDYTPTHHDPEQARLTGAPGIYANTPFILAMLECGVRDWMGLEGRLLELDIRMRHFNVAGEVLGIGGCVSAIEPLGDEAGLDPAQWGEVVVDCWIDAAGKRNVEAVARVALRCGSPG